MRKFPPWMRKFPPWIRKFPPWMKTTLRRSQKADAAWKASIELFKPLWVNAGRTYEIAVREHLRRIRGDSRLCALLNAAAEVILNAADSVSLVPSRIHCTSGWVVTSTLQWSEPTCTSEEVKLMLTELKPSLPPDSVSIEMRCKYMIIMEIL